MIDDTIWFLLIMWLILIIVSYLTRAMILGLFSALIGIFFGFAIITYPFTVAISNWLGPLIIFLNIYIMYDAMFGWIQKKT